MEDRIKYLKMKFIMSIVSTVLIMVITGSLIGMTFAWFSSSAVPQTATIVLETEKIFTLTFIAHSSSDTYKGQTAIEYKTGTTQTVGKLVNYSPANPAIDPNDYPYVFTTTITLSTENLEKALNIKIISATITDDGGVVLNPDRKTEDKVPYGFTWYFEDSTHLYTPYGTFNKGTPYTFVSNEVILRTIEPTDYHINIVFAPEKLYWLQKFKSTYGINDQLIRGTTGALLTNDDYVYTNTSIYSLAEQHIITYESFPNQIYYSVNSYEGCHFEFEVEMFATDPTTV